MLPDSAAAGRARAQFRYEVDLNDKELVPTEYPGSQPAARRRRRARPQESTGRTPPENYYEITDLADIQLPDDDD